MTTLIDTRRRTELRRRAGSHMRYANVDQTEPHVDCLFCGAKIEREVPSWATRTMIARALTEALADHYLLDHDPYFCPTSGQTEDPILGGFTTCCLRPDLHRPAP